MFNTQSTDTLTIEELSVGSIWPIWKYVKLPKFKLTINEYINKLSSIIYIKNKENIIV